MSRRVRRLIVALGAWTVLAIGLWPFLIPRPRFSIPDQHAFMGFSPDGRHLVTATIATVPGGRNHASGPLHVWNCRSGVRCCEIPAKLVNSSGISFNPDGDTIAIASKSEVQIVHLATGSIAQQFTARGSVQRLNHLPDGALLIVCRHPSFEGDLLVERISPRPAAARIGPVEALFDHPTFAITPDGRYAVTVGNVAEHVMLLGLSLDQAPVATSPLARLPMGAYVFGDLADATYGQARRHNAVLRIRDRSVSFVRFWDLNQNQEIGQTRIPYSNWPTVAISADGRQAALTRQCRNGDKSQCATEIYDVCSGKKLCDVACAVRELIEVEHRLQFSKDAQTLFIRGLATQAIDLTGAEPVDRGLSMGGPLSANGDLVAQDLYTPVGPQVLGMGEKKDFAVVVNRLPSGAEALKLSYPGDLQVRPLIFSPDGRFLVLKVNPTAAPNPLQQFIAEAQQWIQSIGMTTVPRSNSIELHNDNRIVNVATGREVARFNSPGLVISQNCSYAPDGQTLRLGDVIWDGQPSRPWLWIVGLPALPALLIFICRWRKRPLVLATTG